MSCPHGVLSSLTGCPQCAQNSVQRALRADARRDKLLGVYDLLCLDVLSLISQSRPLARTDSDAAAHLIKLARKQLDIIESKLDLIEERP